MQICEMFFAKWQLWSVDLTKEFSSPAGRKYSFQQSPLVSFVYRCCCLWGFAESLVKKNANLFGWLTFGLLMRKKSGIREQSSSPVA